MTGSPVRILAPAKVNLFLRVLAREADGFHGIETLFCLVDLADEIVVRRTDGTGVALEVAGADLGPPEANLATRAARLVLDATGRKFGVHVELTKRIPTGAGLGGGSSDAAATLAAVNQLAGNAVPRHELLQFAARLGSDVPFFFSGASLALAWGHGDRMLRLPALPPTPALLLTPAVAVSTPEAYRWLDAARGGEFRRGAVALDLDALRTWGDVARMAGNEFESAVFGREPSVRSAFEALVATRPLVCRMSGSGSTIFAAYRNVRDRDDARMMLGSRHGTVRAVMTGPPAGSGGVPG